MSEILSLGANYVPLRKPIVMDVLAEYRKVVDEVSRIVGIPLRFKQVMYYIFKIKFLRYVQKTNFVRMRGLSLWIKTNNLVIKKADKNLGLTIMPAHWYNFHIMVLLTDRNNYLPVQMVDFAAIAQLIKSIVDRHKECISGRDYNLLTCTKTESIKVPTFYGIPKLHKSPVVLRPIVSSINWVTTAAAKWIDRTLQECIRRVPWICENSIQVINALESTVCSRIPTIMERDPLSGRLVSTTREYVGAMPEDVILVTADVESLYTNINQSEAQRVLGRFLAEPCMGLDRPKRALVMALIRIVMENNYFIYRNTIYHQVCGTAMGCNAAPVYANLFIAAYEFYFRRKNYWPRLYFRYIDDIFFVWEGTLMELHQFKVLMNQLSPSLKLTFQEGPRVNFLDLNIEMGARFRSTGILDISCYRKPNNPLLYTDPTTYNKRSVRFNWIQGETVRIIRNSSSLGVYTDAMTTFVKALTRRKYPREEIDLQISKKSYENRLQYLHPEIVDTPTANDSQQPIRVFIRNLIGRHMIERGVRELLELHKAFYHDTDLNMITFGVRKGHTIMDTINSAVKKVIGALPLNACIPEHMICKYHSRPNNDE